ncbi:MAG: hypothetical protein ACC656_00520 [Candidatus Heimdallarchaeota archaeon]
MQQFKDILETHPEYTSIEWGKKQLEICPFKLTGNKKEMFSFYNEDDNHIRLFVNVGTKYYKLILVIEQKDANNKEQTILAKNENVQELLKPMLNAANTLNQKFKINQEYKRQISELQFKITSTTLFQSLKSGHKTTSEKIWNKF